MKQFALAILKPLIRPWLYNRALHIPEKLAPTIAKSFGFVDEEGNANVAALRELEKFYADYAVGQLDAIVR